MDFVECIKCKNKDKMTEMNPCWNLYEPIYPPNYICKSCQPERSKREDFGRCKCCDLLYKKNISKHICDECISLCERKETIIAFPRDAVL